MISENNLTILMLYQDNIIYIYMFLLCPCKQIKREYTSEHKHEQMYNNWVVLLPPNPGT